ncbi:MAG: hypothetical protein K9K30_10925 [Burkholderiaceae bacterium]|nr:hypothetical protein [Sulfuritalea sp.]MCF8175738.1 hypothetical protein [Burkholderiaceae bacterium]
MSEPIDEVGDGVNGVGVQSFLHSELPSLLIHEAGADRDVARIVCIVHLPQTYYI